MLENAKWIASPAPAKDRGLDYVVKFNVKEGILRASLTATAVGVYAPYLNGVRIGKGVLAPGLTSYKKRILYQTYELSDIREGENELRIGLGSGWAVGFFGWCPPGKTFYGEPALIASIDIEYEDGTRQQVLSDTGWDVYTSRVTRSNIYDGEDQDLSASATLLGKAIEAAAPPAALEEQDGEWIVERERVRPLSLIVTPKGERVVDFGQNLCGYPEIRIKGSKGDRIKLDFAEVLDKDGNFYRENYRKAKSESLYVLSGEEDLLKPLYSFFGFRYMRLTEYPFDEVELDNFTAVTVYSDMKRIGDFTCGNAKINQLYHNIIWGQRSNFLDIPTDCPQRDERLGWTGDAQVFCRTASLNYDTERFYKKWLRDVILEQSVKGEVWGVVPGITGDKPSAKVSAAWGDVACVLPFEIYLNYGDRELLRRHLPLMKNWVDYMHGAGPEEYLWLGGDHFGDWLAMDAGEDSYVGATSTDLIASAYFAYSTSLYVKALKALGEDSAYYEDLQRKVKAAFLRRFTDGGTPKHKVPTIPSESDIRRGTDPSTLPCRCDTQCALTLMLHFGLCKDENRAALTDMLVKLIEENGNRMTTGFVGTPYILHALTDNGRADVAYRLLLQEKAPSWLYSVNKDATTMWEHWNGIKEDGSFWSKDMNSFNHYAYGAVYDWIFGKALGVRTDEEQVAFAHVSIEPHPSRELGFASGSLETRHGRIRVGWYYKQDSVHYEIELAEGMSARLTLPSGKTVELCGGSHLFAEPTRD